MKSATAATANIPMMTKNAAVATRFFRSFLARARQYPSGRRSFFISNPRIDERVQKIRNKNTGEGHQSAQCEDSHQQRIVAVEHGFVAEKAHAWDREQCFDNNASADQGGQNISHQRDYRNKRVPQCVAVYDNALAQTLSTRCANEVLPNGLEHTRPHVARENSQGVIAHTRDRQNQMTHLVS